MEVMNESAGERRLAENEVIFRQANQQAVESLEQAREEELSDHVKPSVEQNLSLFFYCECADDGCKQRIKMPLAEYEANHRQSNQFIILPGHEVPNIEKVVKKEQGYFVVQKYMTPPKETGGLHPMAENI